MKDIDQNLAVAKFHGWEEIRHNPKTDLWYGKPPQDAAHPWDVVIPDYGKDLNAMHKAEKVLIDRGMDGDYEDALVSVCNGSWSELVFASASQRREALLRCLNLWVEE